MSKPAGDQTLDLRYVPVEQIRPNDWNPYEESSSTFEALCDEIREHGFIDPIHVAGTQGGLFVILGGQHRWMAAKEVGLKTIPCIVLGDAFDDQDLQKFMTFRLNLRGKINPAKFARLYADMRLRYSEDQLKKLLAFTDQAAWKALTKQVASGVKKALGDAGKGDVGSAIDKAIQGASPGSDIGKIINHIMKKHGASLAHGFMVFSFGGQEQIYIAMTPESREAMHELITITEERMTNINLLMGPMLRGFVDQLRDQEVPQEGEEEEAEA
jgi:hypothetical protein